MQIKQLEIKGFKSFKNRTVIRFGKATNCILGPNGCGKSNVMDAFLWVSGESSSRHLRGSSMEDLIFSGTDKHPGAGIAEVSLILESAKAPQEKSPSSEAENTTRFPPPYENHTEIMLTRRLDRDGKSEYLINSQPCRLKDVQDIFMDTGAGIHGFSFIEQGAVERFILSKPEQKRRLIESTAGISRFRHKKKEAERKLDLTEVNLKRLKDILSAQESRQEKLKKQYEKAEQFKNLKKQIQEKDLLIRHRDLTCIEQEQDLLKQQIHAENQKAGDSKKQLSQKTARIKKWRLTFQEGKTNAEQTEEDLRNLRSRFLSLEKKLAGLKTSLELNRKHRPFQKEPEKTSLLTRLKESEIHLQLLNKKQRELSQNHERIKTEYEHALKKVSDLNEKKQNLETEKIKKEHQRALSGEREKAFLKGIKNHEKEEDEIKARLENRLKEAKKIQAQKTSLKEELEKNRQLSFRTVNSAHTIKQEVEAFKKEIRDQELLLKKTEEEALALYSEWETLQKTEQSLLIQDKGIKFVLESAEKTNMFKDISSAFRVQSPLLEKAISSYLGLRFNSVFCSEEKSALSAFTLLNKNNKGPCRFIVKELAQQEEREEAKDMEKEQGFQFFLKDQVEGEKDLIHLLFARTAVVTDIQSALSLRKKYPAWSFLTVKGEVLTMEGDLIGGGYPPEQMNIPALRRALKKLPAQYEEKNKQKEIIKSRLKHIKTLLQKNRDKLSTLNKEEGISQLKVLEINKDIESLNRDQERAMEETGILKQKIKEHQAGRMRLQKNRPEGLPPSEQGALEKNLENTKAHLNTVKQETQNLLKQKNEAEKQRAECEIKLASVREKLLSLKQNLKEEQEREKNLLSFSLEKKARIQTIETSLREARKEKHILQKRIRTQEEQSLRFTKERAELEESINKEQSAVMDLQGMLTEQDSFLNKLKLNLESLRLKKTALLEQAMEKYHFTEGQIKALSIPPDFDREKEEENLQKLQNRLSRVGEVNLLALKEYEELKKENEFYQTQYEDLRASKQKLSQAIKRIDGFCSKKFKEVFDEVNSRFSRVWPVLFEGGKAEMILTKDPEKEEEGMDIMVQPPGKKIQSMSLLSGGEKAMTAVAVIFSLFLVKPSPFCILDEVDAPLDDVNTVRFNSLLAEMAKISQVIIITHNKYTMKECDRLYGVTMEDKGVSKVMSLNMSKSLLSNRANG